MTLALSTQNALYQTITGYAAKVSHAAATMKDNLVEKVEMAMDQYHPISANARQSFIASSSFELRQLKNSAYATYFLQGHSIGEKNIEIYAEQRALDVISTSLVRITKDLRSGVIAELNLSEPSRLYLEEQIDSHLYGLAGFVDSYVRTPAMKEVAGISSRVTSSLLPTFFGLSMGAKYGYEGVASAVWAANELSTQMSIGFNQIKTYFLGSAKDKDDFMLREATSRAGEGVAFGAMGSIPTAVISLLRAAGGLAEYHYSKTGEIDKELVANGANLVLDTGRTLSIAYGFSHMPQISSSFSGDALTSSMGDVILGYGIPIAATNVAGIGFEALRLYPSIRRPTAIMVGSAAALALVIAGIPYLGANASSQSNVNPGVSVPNNNAPTSNSYGLNIVDDGEGDGIATFQTYGWQATLGNAANPLRFKTALESILLDYFGLSNTKFTPVNSKSACIWIEDKSGTVISNTSCATDSNPVHTLYINVGSAYGSVEGVIVAGDAAGTRGLFISYPVATAGMGQPNLPRLNTIKLDVPLPAGGSVKIPQQVMTFSETVANDNTTAVYTDTGFIELPVNRAATIMRTFNSVLASGPKFDPKDPQWSVIAAWNDDPRFMIRSGMGLTVSQDGDILQPMLFSNTAGLWEFPPKSFSPLGGYQGKYTCTPVASGHIPQFEATWHGADNAQPNIHQAGGLDFINLIGVKCFRSMPKVTTTDGTPPPEPTVIVIPTLPTVDP
jgi:hypothetical protein